MFWSSLQLKYPTKLQMVIVDPPHPGIVLFWCVLSLFGLFLLLRKIHRRTVLGGFGGILMIGAALCAWNNSHSAEVCIDKGKGRVTFDFPFPRGTCVFPLTVLQSASADAAPGQLVFLLQNGQRQTLGTPSDRKNQRATADAVNQFLSSSQ